MSTFTITADMSEWTSALRRLKNRAVTAQVRALNRSASTARTGMTRLVAADMQLKVSTVRDRIAIENASPSKLSAVLRASMKRVPLVEFGAKGPEPSRGKGRGVTAKTGARRYPHAFFATMRSGHRGVFQRKGKNRLPIDELRGASVGHVFSKYYEEGTRIAQEALLKNLKHEFAFALREAAQKGV